MTPRLERAVVALTGGVATFLAGSMIGLGSVVGPTMVFAAAVALLVAAAAFYSLTFGIILITVLTFFEAVPTLGEGVTFVRLAGLVVILAWLRLALNRHSGIQLLVTDFPAYGYVVVLFVTWVAATALWAPIPSRALSATITLALVAVLLVITYSAITDARRLRFLLWAFVLGALGTTVYGIVLGLGTKNENRLIGGIENPNDLAASLVPAIVLAGVLAVTSRRPGGRLLALTALAVCVVALFMTQSRGGLFGLAIALVVAAIIGGSLRPHAFALLLVFAAIGLGNYFLVANTSDRERLADLSASGSSGRADTWRLALSVAGDHPLQGVGMASFQEVQTRYVTDSLNLLQIRTVLKRPVPHNVYLQLLAEVGIIGLLLYLAVVGGALAIAARSVRQLAKVGDRDGELLGRGVIVAIVGLVALSTFHGSLIEKELWLLLGAAAALSSLARQSGTPAARTSVNGRLEGHVAGIPDAVSIR